MTAPAFDRDSLIFKARRLAQGIEVQAEFQAQKVSNPGEGVRYYSVILTIDPLKKGVSGSNWFLTKRNSASPSAYEGAKDKLRLLEKQVRNEILNYPAWEILLGREPDPTYYVDELGKAIVPEPPMKRR